MASVQHVSSFIDTDSQCVCVYSCRLFQPDQHYLWRRVRILYWRNVPHNVWWCKV